MGAEAFAIAENWINWHTEREGDGIATFAALSSLATKGATVVCERHCGRGVLMCETDERARSDRRCLLHTSIGGSETPAF